MKVDLKDMTPFTRQEKFMYAIAERLERLLPQEEIKAEEVITIEEPVIEKSKKVTKKKSTKKKVDDNKNE